MYTFTRMISYTYKVCREWTQEKWKMFPRRMKQVRDSWSSALVRLRAALINSQHLGTFLGCDISEDLPTGLPGHGHGRSDLADATSSMGLAARDHQSQHSVRDPQYLVLEDFQ